jgi:hypothetical protein
MIPIFVAAMAGASALGVMVKASTPGSAQVVSGTDILAGVACSSAITCEAVGYDSSNQGVVVTITSGTPGSAQVVSDTRYLADVACPSATTCEAVGTNSSSEGVVVTITSSPPGGGYTLDAYGGVHAFGDSPPVTITGYWPGWQIANSIAMDPCDTTEQYSGWVMDGFGGLHPFAAAGTPMPAVPDITGYWPNWDIANDVAAFCINVGGVAHAAGCVLDGFGGLHPWADSSAVIGDVICNGTGYWSNWDIATKITVIPGTDEGYVMDGFGGIHPFNGAHSYAPSGYWPGWTIARGIVATATGGYTVDGFGGIHPFGSAPAITPTGYWPGWDIVTGIAMAQGGNGGAYTLDGFGGVHPAGGAPSLWVSDYFPNSDIVVGLVTAP